MASICCMQKIRLHFYSLISHSENFQMQNYGFKKGVKNILSDKYAIPLTEIVLVAKMA